MIDDAPSVYFASVRTRWAEASEEDGPRGEYVHLESVWSTTLTHGLRATLVTAAHRFGKDPDNAETASGAGKFNLLQYTSGCTS